MWGKVLVVMTTFVCSQLSPDSVFAQQSMASISVKLQAAQKKDPRELVIRLKNAKLEDLKELSFLELNFLKNAVYASKGYKFAQDRSWLTEFFCSESSQFGSKTKRRTATQQRSGDPLEQWIEGKQEETSWDLSLYKFPECRENGNVDEDQAKALANIRIALLKKIDDLHDIDAVNQEFNEEMEAAMADDVFNGEQFWVLGRTITYSWGRPGATSPYTSLLRDVQGYHRLLQLVRDVERDFDPMELLGLYAGDIVFFKNIIEAKYGRQFGQTLGWEISQLIGVTEKKLDYSPKKLPVKIQTKLQVLDEITQKIMQSDLKDFPSSIKDNSVDMLTPYRGGAC